MGALPLPHHYTKLQTFDVPVMTTDQTARLSKIAFEAMGTKAAGSVFWAIFVVLLPVSVQISSSGCVTYKHRRVCGLKGSSVEFPCSYPSNRHVISISGWSKKLHPDMRVQPLKDMPAYSHRMIDLHRGNNDCTMKLKDLKHTDASVYYFVYKFRNVAGDIVTCNGVPGVRLDIFTSPVRIQVKRLVNVEEVPDDQTEDQTVMEGQSIMLTCFSTCAANLNSYPGYIWKKNGLQLNGRRANSPFLFLDSVGNEDAGIYVCAMIGYEHLPSFAVTLKVLRRPPRDFSGGDSKEDSAPTQTHGYETQNSTDRPFNKYQTHESKSVFTFFSIMLAAGVCMGWVIAIMVTILVIRMKKERKNKRARSVASVPEPPNPNNDCYMTLDLNSKSADYDTLDTVRHSAADHVYENLDRSRNSPR